MSQRWSGCFPSGSRLRSAGNQKPASKETKKKILELFKILLDEPIVSVQRLKSLLSKIPEDENILSVCDEEGFNLLQRCVGVNNIGMVRWILSRNPDLNRGICSLPLHIACLKGYSECVKELIKKGARVDVEARMCWPGPHSQHCGERVRCVIPNNCLKEKELQKSKERPHNAIYYAVDGDEVGILQYLLNLKAKYRFRCTPRTPVLHMACERGAWECTKYLVSARAEEINMCYDEYYPVHHAVLHDIKFLNLLIENHASTTVVTADNQRTLLHILFIFGRQSGSETYQTCRLLLKNGLKEYINAPDSLGNTPLHGLIVRCALEETRDVEQWNKWDMLLLMHFMLLNGGSPSINQPRNSALAGLLRHVKDCEFRYDLLYKFLQDGGNPNITGKDGSTPLMVCLVPLLNNNALHSFTHSKEAYHKNCVRILCERGANLNPSGCSNLSPLRFLVYTASENIPLAREEEKALNFEYIRNLILLLLRHGSDPNDIQRTPHILQRIVEMVKNTRTPQDTKYVYDLILTLIQYGANPNVNISANIPMSSCHSQAHFFTTESCKYLLGYYIHLISKKEAILVDSDKRFARILYLFYMCMDHDELYGNLKFSIAEQNGVIHSTGSQILYNTVKELYSTPRSLKQLCRLTIHKCLDRRPGFHADDLPLPCDLKEYVLDFNP